MSDVCRTLYSRNQKLEPIRQHASFASSNSYSPSTLKKRNILVKDNSLKVQKIEPKTKTKKVLASNFTNTEMTASIIVSQQEMSSRRSAIISKNIEYIPPKRNALNCMAKPIKHNPIDFIISENNQIQNKEKSSRIAYQFNLSNKGGDDNKYSLDVVDNVMNIQSTSITSLYSSINASSPFDHEIKNNMSYSPNKNIQSHSYTPSTSSSNQYVASMLLNPILTDPIISAKSRILCRLDSPIKILFEDKSGKNKKSINFIFYT